MVIRTWEPLSVAVLLITESVSGTISSPSTVLSSTAITLKHPEVTLASRVTRPERTLTSGESI